MRASLHEEDIITRDDPIEVRARRRRQIFQIMAHRTAGSVLGAKDDWLKQNGVLVQYDSKAPCEDEVARLNRITMSKNVWYELVEVDI